MEMESTGREREHAGQTRILWLQLQSDWTAGGGVPVENLGELAQAAMARPSAGMG